ncbi:hypothetical protein CKAH01_00271 [Colletotrichum kahawae]|uniref:Uncharacterized protein n=1 Tax=Colletotrichum kahawae TaxID=34407 RepID=A0AAE0DE95_COLKA|nr:hypothetical protein CKAH01_00271 [Colletotrichum kahawae]
MGKTAVNLGRATVWVPPSALFASVLGRRHLLLGGWIRCQQVCSLRGSGWIGDPKGSGPPHP